MTSIAEDHDREERIINDIVVDAYDETERALGWHCYLSDNLSCPFKAECKAVRKTSPLRLGEKVTVKELASEDECMNEIFVMVTWSGRQLAVPLAQLSTVNADEDTRQAVEDWHYWCARGYQF